MLEREALQQRRAESCSADEVNHKCPMSTTETILYFAYGSNMLSRRLQERTPSARPVAIGKISGNRLCWYKRSRMARVSVMPMLVRTVTSVSGV